MNFFFNDSIVWIFAYCLYCFDVYFLYRLYYVDLLNALYTRRWWCRCVPQFRSLTGTNDLVWISRECRKRKLILVFFFGKHNADDWYGTISSFAQLVVLYLCICPFDLYVTSVNVCPASVSTNLGTWGWNRLWVCKN